MSCVRNGQDMSDTTETAEEKEDVRSSTSTLLDQDEEKMGYVDLEKNKSEALGAQVATSSSRLRLVVWMVVNTLATIGIVFTNKAIFSSPAFRQCQFSFASFHFLLTYLTLYILSRPLIALFTPQRVRTKTMLPLAIMMCLNILCLNLSLTFSSITFYQIARILLTPAVAAINFLFYKMKIPKAAVATLIPMCLGVAITSCFEPKSSTASAEPHGTDIFGVVLAFGGVLVSAVYLVWIAAYQRRLEINAFQLLYNQAPIGGLLLLCFVPWTDSLPTDMPRPAGIGTMICLSAVCAVLINISQFYVTMGAGPVSSTVAGHFKTCSIIVLGWMTAGQRITDRSMFGILLAVGSIFLYSMIMFRTGG